MKWIISLLSTKVMFEHNLSDSRRWHELKTSRQLRTERLKDHRTINVRVEFQSLPLPRDISAKCGSCRSETRFKISHL